jgi:hypothetical protein
MPDFFEALARQLLGITRGGRKKVQIERKNYMPETPKTLFFRAFE